MPMIQILSFQNIYTKKIIVSLIIIFFIKANVVTCNDTTIFPCVSAAEPTILWNVTLTISESNGIENKVVFGINPNASDGKDIYDIPSPPMPPTLPAIAAWFDTPFPLPYDKLINECKQSIPATWNLSILWVAILENSTFANITISWDSSQMPRDDMITYLLSRENSIYSDMLVTDSYSYVTNGTVDHFQIIVHNQQSHNLTVFDNIPIIPLLLLLITLIIVIIIIFILRNKRRQKLLLLEKIKAEELEKSKQQMLEAKKSQGGRKTSKKTPKQRKK